MCGLVGFLSAGSANSEDRSRALLHDMADRLQHRGPDDAGYWYCKTGVAIAHRRLAIMDLSAAGHQPMISRCGRYIMAFNGEIYNHSSLRSMIGLRIGLWRGESDTETVLAGISKWGVKETITRCQGMFAFAVWDRRTNLLTLARDRLGEKPIYYGWQDNGSAATFLFGSELDALKVHPSFESTIDREALCSFMRLSYIPSPYSIYRSISKLPPGHLLTVSPSRREVTLEAYWSLENVAIASSLRPLSGSASDLTNELEKILSAVIRQQMISDVPVGAFLSGGIDSSTVVALMQQQSSQPVKTFSIGFNEASFDEGAYARTVANHLGTDHTELYVTADEATTVIPLLPKLYGEPFADSSQIPTYLVSKLARERVTVSLSGDGGDELFAGYNRYVHGKSLWDVIRRLPPRLRKFAATAVTSIPIHLWDVLMSRTSPLLPSFLGKVNSGEKVHRAAILLSATSVTDLHKHLVSHWQADGLVIGARGCYEHKANTATVPSALDETQVMMLLDSLSYLPDDILVKVDRAAMGVSLESRMPFLDHRLVEFAWRVPQTMKIKDGEGKWLLRQLLHRYVPRRLVERPKMGFGVPIASWLRGPLRDWAEDLLSESRLSREGFFNPSPIRRKWTEHLSGKANWQHQIWNALMFQAWLDNSLKHG